MSAFSAPVTVEVREGNSGRVRKFLHIHNIKMKLICYSSSSRSNSSILYLHSYIISSLHDIDCVFKKELII